MKVTLISLSPTIESFGIAILSNCLKREGHDVKLLFLVNQFWNKHEERALDEIVKISSDSDLIGISVTTNFLNNAIQITQRLKGKIPIVWGGIHPTIRHEECLNYADIVCMGEGEESLVELVDKMAQGKDYFNVEGMYFKKDGKVIKNRLRALIQNLDSLPFPDYDIGTGYYILDNGQVQIMTEQHLKKYFSTYTTMATRGCPFSCTYCCNNTLTKMYPGQQVIRRRSPDNLIRELIEIKNKFSFIKRLIFSDDAFFTYKIEEIKEFCEKYKSVGIPFAVTGGHPKTITREKMALLVDAGMVLIRIGLQSGSEKTKKLYGRNYSNETTEETIKIINEFKDRIEPLRMDIILDNPWETENELIETLMFLVKLPKPYYLYFYSLTFFPETALHNLAKREGMLRDEASLYEKCFRDVKDCYINNIFKLLNDIYAWGGSISEQTMRLLTNKKLRLLKLNYLIYGLLKLYGFILRLKWLQKIIRRVQNDSTRYFYKKYVWGMSGES